MPPVYYRMYLEINEVAPVGHPLVQQPPVVGHHQLIAALELVIDQVETYIKPSGAIRPLSLNRRYTDTASLFLNCSITM